tara:strand:- start:11 stop:2176 length:2166 start_codon:yes stop_codon:yes gene_type:complete
MVDIVNIQNALNQAGYGNNAELIEGLLPVTYADNSGFMKDFQPVQNYPNYFVPQQGLLQNTPTLDTLSDLDVMQQRPQSLLNMIDQYPTLENDFQRSFAVNPDTFRGMVYNPAPYTGAFDYGTNTSGGATDLTSLISAGLLGKEIYDKFKDDDATTIKTDTPNTNVTDVTTTISNTGLNTGGTKTGNVGVDTGEIFTNDTVITDGSVASVDDDDAATKTENVGLDTGEILTGTTNIASDTASDKKIEDVGLDTGEILNNTSLVSGVASGLNNFALTGQTGSVNLDTGDILNSNVSAEAKKQINDFYKDNPNLLSALEGKAALLGLNAAAFADTAALRNAVVKVSAMNPTAEQIASATGNLTTTGGNPLSNFLNTELTAGTGANLNALGGSDYIDDLTNINVGEALSGVGGLLSLADFVDDPNISNTLGTAAGLGGFGLFGNAMAAASPYLGAAALVTGLLGIGQKEPSNYTGYTALDLDTFDPQSFGMSGKKFSQENVDMTSQIMEGIAPYIQEIERKYGVDLKGDLQINYGQRDGLAFNLDNADVTGFNQRLDYNPNEGDISTEVGGDVYRESFSGEGSGDKFITSLLGKIEGIAAKTATQGGTEYDFENFDANTDTSLTAEEIDALPEILQTQTEDRILELNKRQYGGLLYENRDAEIADAAGITGGLFFDALDAGLVPENADSDAAQQDILVQLIRYAEDNPEVDLNEVKITDFYNKE